jgi:hypothetical protein
MRFLLPGTLKSESVTMPVFHRFGYVSFHRIFRQGSRPLQSFESAFQIRPVDFEVKFDFPGLVDEYERFFSGAQEDIEQCLVPEVKDFDGIEASEGEPGKAVNRVLHDRWVKAFNTVDVLNCCQVQFRIQLNNFDAEYCIPYLIYARGRSLPQPASPVFVYT